MAFKTFFCFTIFIEIHIIGHLKILRIYLHITKYNVGFLNIIKLSSSSVMWKFKTELVVKIFHFQFIQFGPYVTSFTSNLNKYLNVN